MFLVKLVGVNQWKYLLCTNATIPPRMSQSVEFELKSDSIRLKSEREKSQWIYTNADNVIIDSISLQFFAQFFGCISCFLQFWSEKFSKKRIISKGGCKSRLQTQFHPIAQVRNDVSVIGFGLLHSVIGLKQDCASRKHILWSFYHTKCSFILKWWVGSFIFGQEQVKLTWQQP